MREVVGSSPTATTIRFADISPLCQPHQQFTDNVVLGVVAQGIASQLPPRVVSKIFSRRLPTLLNGPGVETRCVEARMAH